jgi:hypothetical protein
MDSKFLGSVFRILVVENPSEDLSLELFLKTKNLEAVSYIRNQSNIGFIGSFELGLKASITKYIMFVSDEDSVVLKNIPKLVNFLKEKNPFLVSPKSAALPHFWTLRGAALNRKIRLEEFNESTFYISGLVYNASDALKSFLSVKTRFHEHPYFRLYPQGAILIEHFRKSLDSTTHPNAFYFRHLLTNARFQLPSECHSDPDYIKGGYMLDFVEKIQPRKGNFRSSQLHNRASLMELRTLKLSGDEISFYGRLSLLKERFRLLGRAVILNPNPAVLLRRTILFLKS